MIQKRVSFLTIKVKRNHEGAPGFMRARGFFVTTFVLFLRKTSDFRFLNIIKGRIKPIGIHQVYKV